MHIELYDKVPRKTVNLCNNTPKHLCKAIPLQKYFSL